MDNSPYLTILNDGIHNFMLHSAEETLQLQDSNIKSNIFTEIEDVAKEWSVELPVLMEDQSIEESPIELHCTDGTVETAMGLGSNLSNVYDGTLTHSCDMVLETGERENEDNTIETQITYPIEVPDKGFITTEGFFINNDLFFQLDLDENEELASATGNLPQVNTEQVILPALVHATNNGQSLLISKQNPQLKLSNKHASLNNINLNENILLSNTNFVVSKSLNDKGTKNSDIYKNWFDIISAFRCKLCKFLTDERNIIIQHYKLKHLNEDVSQNGHLKTNGEVNAKLVVKNVPSQTIYVCSVCSLGYSSTDKLKLHMILSHKLANVSKELEVKKSTNEDTKDSKSLLKPEEKKKMQMLLLRQQSKASKRIKCSVTGCDLRFALDDMRSRHEKCHIEGQKQFKCSECGQKFSMWRTCSLHLWRCHSLDLGLLTCPMCNNFKASSSVRLVNHMAIHEEDRPYSCTVCEKAFKQHSQLVNHQIIHKDSNLPGWASQQQCDICKKYFSNSKSLKKHVQSVHDKFKPFICSVCGHKTARKSMLKLHLRQHTGEKPHQCPICEYKTGDHNSLRRHLMRHSGRTKYSCPHCQYQSIQSTAYKNHIATKHPGLGGSYFCTLCSYHTVNENTYTSHMGDHEKGLIKAMPEKVGIGGKNKNMSAIIGEKKGCNTEIINNVRLVPHEAEDDESHNYLSLLEHSNDAVDTGGITIPAGFEIPD